MTASTGRFAAEVVRGVDPDGQYPPGPTFVELYLQWYTKNEANGAPRVASDCVCEGEIDGQIDRLKDQLEALRADAKSKLRAQKEKDRKVRAQRRAERE